MTKYKWGIIGAGNIAGKFAEDLKLLPQARLKAVSSRSADRASTFAQKYKIPEWYDSWDAIAADPDLDIVYVATHHPFHFQNTRSCLEAGKAVICEKPITMNRRELDILVRIARENKVFLMEAIWSRFLPSTRKVLEVRKSGELGQLTSVDADFGFRFEFDPEHRLFDPAKGGGALLDIGIYPVFISQLMAGPPEKIKATARFAPTGVDHSCNMIFEHGNEVVSSLNCTLLSDAPIEANLLFEHGWIRMESWWLTPGPITIHRKGRKTKRVKFREPGNGYHHEASEVMQCLDRGLTESPSLPLDFSLDLMGTLDAVRKECGIRYLQDDM
ncbi:MAG: Gfo/Idh/MocA family oxidoreductase [Bacteroidales bacterium]|nr:Gfo/Idh/MocA family oxidoreductase [Bacteroidales bacterium]